MNVCDFLKASRSTTNNVHAGLERRKSLLKWLTSADCFATMVIKRARKLEDLKRDLWIECCRKKVTVSLRKLK